LQSEETRQQSHLRRLAAAVDTLKGNKSSGHLSSLIELTVFKKN